jgi:hypothetical protein
MVLPNEGYNTMNASELALVVHNQLDSRAKTRTSVENVEDTIRTMFKLEMAVGRDEEHITLLGDTVVTETV